MHRHWDAIVLIASDFQHSKYYVGSVGAGQLVVQLLLPTLFAQTLDRAIPLYNRIIPPDPWCLLECFFNKPANPQYLVLKDCPRGYRMF